MRRVDEFGNFFRLETTALNDTRLRVSELAADRDSHGRSAGVCQCLPSEDRGAVARESRTLYGIPQRRGKEISPKIHAPLGRAEGIKLDQPFR